MKIDALDQQSLHILAPERAEVRRAAMPKEAEGQTLAAEPATQTELGLGKDLAGLGEAHTLDPARVAALIADPFGDE